MVLLYLWQIDKQNEIEDTSFASFFQLSEVRLYIVLGCIAALVLIAVIQATCTIYKTSKGRNRQKVGCKFHDFRFSFIVLVVLFSIFLTHSSNIIKKINQNDALELWV